VVTAEVGFGLMLARNNRASGDQEGLFSGGSEPIEIIVIS
jgi:hypothetical protein